MAGSTALIPYYGPGHAGKHTLGNAPLRADEIEFQGRAGEPEGCHDRSQRPQVKKKTGRGSQGGAYV